MNKIRVNDTVLIITGKDRGKTATVSHVLNHGRRVIVSGIGAYKKHVRPSSKYPQGGVIEAYRSLDISNVMILEPESKKPSRVGFIGTGKDKKRMLRLSQKPIVESRP